MDANDQCHRIAHDNHACLYEFHFEHELQIETDQIMMIQMYIDMMEVASEFEKLLANDDSVVDEIGDLMIIYYLH